MPEIDVLVYLWNGVDDFPVVACRHIFYGQKEWDWDCKWGSGYTVSQLVGKEYLWKEIVLPELKEECLHETEDKQKEQLTKAKEHIENLLYYVKQCTCERSNYTEIEKDIKEAEQFLSEVEK